MFQSDLDAVFALEAVVNFNVRPLHWNCSGLNKSGTTVFDYVNNTEISTKKTRYCQLSTSHWSRVILKYLEYQALFSDQLIVFFTLEIITDTFI